jgi:type VI secretion system ImpC/EvpB family protein
MDDLDALRNVSQVAAAAFAPFIASADPSLLGLDSFAELQRPMNLAEIFEQPEYAKWRSLRASEDSRFVGLTMPRILMRLPYKDESSRVDRFRFAEDTSGRGIGGYLWGNAAYAFGAVLIRAFSQSGWLADIRGVRRDLEEGGLVTGLPVESFGTDRQGVAIKSCTDVVITDVQENHISELGFMPLCQCKGTDYAAFYSNASIQKPATYDEQYATANAKISAMLQYMLCVSRVAHYLKVMGREKVGSFMEAQDCESFLNEWLQKYTTHDEDAPQEIKARYPLREARAEVREQPGKPGSYYCVVRLQPHYQLDNMASTIAMTTELAPAEG